jgi:hypothetical protein
MIGYGYWGPSLVCNFANTEGDACTSQAPTGIQKRRRFFADATPTLGMTEFPDVFNGPPDQCVLCGIRSGSCRLREQQRRLCPSQYWPCCSGPEAWPAGADYPGHGSVADGGEGASRVQALRRTAPVHGSGSMGCCLRDQARLTKCRCRIRLWRYLNSKNLGEAERQTSRRA